MTTWGFLTSAVSLYPVPTLPLSHVTLTVNSGRYTHPHTHSISVKQTLIHIACCRWHIAGKSECSAKCGPGYRTLDVQCMRYSSLKRQSERVEGRACSDLPKPQAREACHGNCLLKSWQYSTWSQVSGNYSQRHTSSK